MKDLIFETDRNVLDGIRYNMIRWRKAENLQLGKEYSPSRSFGAANRNSRRAAIRSSTMMVPSSPAMQT